MRKLGPNSRVDAFVKRWLEDTSSMVECHLYVDEGWTYHESNYVIYSNDVYCEYIDEYLPGIVYEGIVYEDVLYGLDGTSLVIWFAKNDGSVMEFWIPLNGIDNTCCLFSQKYYYERRSRDNVDSIGWDYSSIELFCHPSVCRIIEKVLYKRFPDVIRKYHAQYDCYWLERHPKVRFRN